MAQFASGTFTGTNGTELTAHDAAWTRRVNTAENSLLAGNRLRAAGANPSEYYHSGTPASADYTVEVDIYVASLVAGVSAGVFGRGSTDGTKSYSANYHVGTGWRLYLQNTSFTLLKSAAATLTVGNTYRLKLEMIADAIKVYVDGVLVLSDTNNVVTAAGKAGTRFYDNTSAPGDAKNFHLDNFSADDPGATPLVGTSLSQDTELGTGAVTITGIFVGEGLIQDNQLGTGAVTVTGSGITLVGESIDDIGASGTGALTISHILSGDGLDQDTELGTASLPAPPSALTAEQSAWLYGIALLHGLVDGIPLTVSASARSAGAVTQTIAEVAGTVTVTTTTAPSGAPGTSALNTQETQWLEDLARIYGLIDPLEVTATARGDGTLSQTIAEVSGTTTVTKI